MKYKFRVFYFIFTTIAKHKEELINKEYISKVKKLYQLCIQYMFFNCNLYRPFKFKISQ